MTTTTKARRLVPAALVALSLVPILAGAARLAELAGGAELTPHNARFFASPLPVVLHVLSASVYCVLGACQFAPDFRRRRPGWHRVAGRLLVACGLLAGLSGLWMTLFYPRAEGDGVLLDGLRLLFGAAMVLSLVLGLAAILRRDVGRHRAWSIRGYAIGLGAGTQVLVSVPWFLIVGTPGELARALLLGAGWVINLAVAERVIRRQTASPVRAAQMREGLLEVRASVGNASRPL
ncbi:hypothetical protein COCOR_06882 [Corallococcus coralloides DSM 2259]|uniref:DUF2306 domain-containing protein n=1 Tax=Corallococcus coralloides (strain ATCC 25202 / DSM 2259 / NBRC 100086 / M2) TaxID=1144275 RepID=H8N126_CORCM|nr:DUF2306 domain-containing protein [Corallococcus coralloides]AFE07193.1 hypothetical protein COCOR_06882 [Corallococcus coralloides DSM 2259]